ncbi:TIGR01777 family oxidoreductase [Brevibacterium luteolum]|uniref:TIGR01777 family oxidoreductase n=1 Tax=Brevibacterium luteolum TaxID=199591 RepID=UPI001C244897|nr:TIGR01777 family oxidoreductase [Brevibacterium luteolum]MBU8579757.1 TIGR01777 family oxidoreductase [Brevibacterium luteolum]
MAVFTSSLVVPYPLHTVFAWHRRPGALTRLSPEWAMQIEQEADPLTPGSQASMKITLPGTHGLVRTPFSVEHAEGPSEHSFIDRQVRGPLSSWKHTHTFTEVTGAESVGSAFTRIDDHIDYSFAPGILPGATEIDATAMEPTLRAIFTARSERLLADLAYQDELTAFGGTQRKKILIAGASGTVGSQVAALLSTGGHDVRTLVRGTPWKDSEVKWNPDLGILDPNALAWADVVIHLGGATIGTRFSPAAKERIMRSRRDSTKLIVLTMEQLSENRRPEAFICASAIGYYGYDRGDEELSEDAGPGNGFLAEVCRAWEEEAAQAEALGVRWVSVRTAQVLTALSGPLRLQLPLYLSGLGGRIGTGQQWMSWISLDDIARIYARAAIDPAMSGPVNAAAPQPVRQAEFAQALAGLASMPALVPTPRLGPEVLLGKQAAQELVLADQRVVPTGLDALGYRFRYPEIRQAMADALGFPDTHRTDT